jgi:hypothetical protein
LEKCELKKHVASRPVLRKMLKELLQVKRKMVPNGNLDA